MKIVYNNDDVVEINASTGDNNHEQSENDINWEYKTFCVRTNNEKRSERCFPSFAFWSFRLFFFFKWDFTVQTFHHCSLPPSHIANTEQRSRDLWRCGKLIVSNVYLFYKLYREQIFINSSLTDKIPFIFPIYFLHRSAIAADCLLAYKNIL